ncbi:MAG: ATP-binding cassette domain-containing protein [Nitrospirae bacterium]|nr:ATP-binding cassette domain-containing protein [Nitrospirota bacterium]
MPLTLSVSGVHKHYGGNHVLRGVTFEFGEAGTYVFMGPNGSGKSTLLRVAALLERQDEGSVGYHSGAETLKADIALIRRITLVLPKVGVFNSSAFENVAYGLRIRGVGRKEIKEKAEKALDSLGLLHKRNQRAALLSSGEQQRLGLARALAIEPEVLFLDEPTASVDEKNTRIIEDLLVSIRKEANRVVVIATHDKEQAAKQADRLLYLKDGRIVVP